MKRNVQILLFQVLNTGTGRAKNCPKLHKTLTQHFRHFMLELIGWKGTIVEHRRWEIFR